MKKFQKLFDEASKKGKLGELVIQKTAYSGECYLTKKNENSWELKVSAELEIDRNLKAVCEVAELGLRA